MKHWQENLHRFTALLVFLYALALYGATVSPSVALWDPGEFIASAHGLQVMHPPGAPFYILLGRLFSMFVPAGYVALAVNLVSVVAAAVTVLLAYLIIVRLVVRMESVQPAGRRAPSPYAAMGAGVVGALTLAATGSFWFNAVEAEVYALSVCFTALIVWLTLRWSDEAAQETEKRASPFAWLSHRYLVLIAYLFGLSVGIHLMSVLTFFFIAPIAFFTFFDRPEWTWRRRVLGLGATAGFAAAGFLLLYPGVVIVLPEAAQRSGAPVLFLAGVLVLLVGGLLYTQRRRFPLANLALLCVAALLAGYSSYTLIPIRSAANPPIDLNNPETAEELVPYLKRDQYGQTPLLRGPSFDDRTGQIDYDRSVLFPRRHMGQPEFLGLYGGYDSDWDYFWRYQVGHMYVRYFLWNFAGRAHDEQHAGWITGFSAAETAPYVYTTPSERASRNAYFGLPLLLGLFGLLYHLRCDARRALSLLALFLITGLGLVLYLNEVPVTPRERDYIYVGSYFTFCLWIGVGAAGLMHRAAMLVRRLRRFSLPPVGAMAAAGALLFLAVPLWMTVENYDDHDRSGNYLGRDFAYNMLMSLDENAVLFTRGDNDTYPLWYLQDVEGVRRDVRIACLSLLQTGWYAKQLKHQRAYDAVPVPISLSDEALDALRAVAWQPREVRLPVEAGQLTKQAELRISVKDTSGFESPMRWALRGRPYSADVRILYPNDQVVLNILAENARQGWPRPIYFAATTVASDQLDLQPFLQREGLAYRVVPVRHDRPNGRVVPAIMKARLAHFRFMHLDNPDVYYADDARSMAGFHYRLTYTDAADTLIEDGQQAEARRLMDALMDEVPPDTIPIHPSQALSLARTYLALGVEARSVSIVREAEPRVLHQVRTAASQASLEQAVRYVQALQYTYARARAFDEAAGLSDQLAAVLGDDRFRQTPDDFRRMYDDGLRP